MKKEVAEFGGSRTVIGSSLQEEYTPMHIATYLVGPKQARRAVRPLVKTRNVVEVTMWHELPSGPAVVVDARRFEQLSAGGIEVLARAVAEGATLAVPGSNAAAWPVCGLQPPRGSAKPSELAAHVRDIADLPSEEFPAESLTLPAVFAVADTSMVTSRPERIADIADSFTLVASVWNHRREVPLLSLAMIVKNEASRIARTLELAGPLVDEVVVYDTGSDDDTVAIARSCGAVVRQGYWDDDFGRARNEAFAMARGEWVMFLDGDDELMATPEQCAELRFGLAVIPDDAAISLRLRNLTNAATGQIDAGFITRRVFRRGVVWRNRIHEMAFTPQGEELSELQYDGVWIRHTGYVDDLDERVERNQRIAAKRLVDSEIGWERTMAIYEVARAHMLNNENDLAIERFTTVVEAIVNPENLEQLHIGSSARLNLSLLQSTTLTRDQQLHLLEPLLVGGGTASDAARWVLVMANQDDVDQCLAWLTGIDAAIYLPPVTVSYDTIVGVRALLYALKGDADTALAELEKSVQVTGELQAWSTAAMTLRDGDGRCADFVIARACAADLPKAVASLAEMPPGAAHEIVMGLWKRFGADPALVAYVANLTHRAGFLNAIEGRMLLAEAGELASGDPLQRIIDLRSGDVADQMLAALVLDEFAPRASSQAAAVGATIDDALIEPVLAAVSVVMPVAVNTVVAAVSTSPARRALAEAFAGQLSVGV